MSIKEKRPAGRFFFGAIVALHTSHSDNGKTFFDYPWLTYAVLRMTQVSLNSLIDAFEGFLILSLPIELVWPSCVGPSQFTA
jgi:hypothetical protein